MTVQPLGHTVTLFIIFSFCDFSVKDITLSREMFFCNKKYSYQTDIKKESRVRR